MAGGLTARATGLTRDAVGLALQTADRLLSFGYDLAKVNRRTADWIRPATSPNAETSAAAEIPAASAHDLARNSTLAHRAKQVVTSRIIGRGLTPNADPEWVALFEAWAPHCYVSNRANFARIQTMAMEAMAEGGEVIIRRRWRRTEDVGWNGLPLALPFQLQMIEGQQIDRLKDGPAPGGGRYVQGIEYNAIGRPVAIWLFQDHPGDPWYGTSSVQSVPVDYADLIHLFREDRPGQARGMTWFAASGTTIRKLGTYLDTELMRKNAEACTVNWIYNDNLDPDLRDEQGRLLAPATKDSQGRVIEKPAPMQNVYVPPGYKVQPHTPQPVQGYAEFVDEEEGHVAQGWGIPFYALSGKLQNVSYSAARIGDVETRTWVYPFQEQVIVPLFLDVIAQWCTEAAIASRKLRGTVADWPVEWQAPAVEEHDRESAAKADSLEVRGGYTTKSERIRARGWKPEKVRAERKKELEDDKAAGIVNDSSPNEVTQNGQAQYTNAPNTPKP